MRTAIWLVSILGFGMLGACASDPSREVYTQRQAGSAYNLEYGEVLEVRVVTVEGNPGIIGTWGGATVGRAIGQTRSNRRNSRIVGGAIGGVAGAIAGRAIERKLTEDEALEITVQLDRGDAIVVVQAEETAFEPGDRVRVLRNGGNARVSHL